MANRKTAKKRFLKECKIKAYIESLKDLENMEEADNCNKKEIDDYSIHD